VILIVGALTLITAGLAALVALIQRNAAQPDLYPPEAAEAPTYERARLLDEVGPAVVAGSDMDRLCRPDRAQMALRFRLLVDESLSDLRSVDSDLAPLYVVPEVER